MLRDNLRQSTHRRAERPNLFGILAVGCDRETAARHRRVFGRRHRPRDCRTAAVRRRGPSRRSDMPNLRHMRNILQRQPKTERTGGRRSGGSNAVRPNDSARAACRRRHASSIESMPSSLGARFCSRNSIHRPTSNESATCLDEITDVDRVAARCSMCRDRAQRSDALAAVELDR